MEIAIVVVIALLVFGPKRLPELGSGLGRGLREFKESVTGAKGDDEEPPALERPGAVAAPDSAADARVLAEHKS